MPRQGKSWPLRYGDPMHDAKVVKDTCTLRDFHNALRARDPLGTGFDESTDLLLHLIWKLLAWDPLYRLKPSQALQHPYFTAPTMPQSTHDNLPVERIILSSTFANYNPLFPGPHNALESQLLDANLDMNSSFAVSEFICPKCGKKHADHNSCQQHARSRRHALFCSYDRTALPHCLNAHTMLPHHPSSGYCDIQGRRRTIEDFHSVHLHNANQFYGEYQRSLYQCVAQTNALKSMDEQASLMGILGTLQASTLRPRPTGSLKQEYQTSTEIFYPSLTGRKLSNQI